MSDKKDIGSTIGRLEQISENIIRVVKLLKQEIKFSDDNALGPKLKECHIKFYKNILLPLFKKGKDKFYSREEILKECERKKSNIKSLNTVNSYLLVLKRSDYLKVIKDEKDNKRKLYQLSQNNALTL